MWSQNKRYSMFQSNHTVLTCQNNQRQSETPFVDPNHLNGFINHTWD